MSGARSKRRGRPTTIYDLAEIAKTSPSAVSAVLNGSWKKRRIASSTAERVLRIAEAEGYARNVQASALRGRSNVIGMIIPKYDNRYFGAIAEQFETHARSRNLFPVITCTQRDPELELEAAREMLGYRVDHIVATGATNPDGIAQLCAKAGVHTINLDLPGHQAPSVISDNYGGARELAGLVLDRSERPGEPLLFIGGRASDHNTAARLAGVRDAHADRAIAMPETHVLACGYAAEKAIGALEALRIPLPAALFVNSTISLEGIVGWLRKSQRQCHIGCFDWDPFAAFLPEVVGMARQDVSVMMETVFEMLDDETASTTPVQVPCIVS